MPRAATHVEARPNEPPGVLVVAAGVLLYGAGRVNVQNNKISASVESPIDNSGVTGGHVKP